jgi:hypothetical protein
MNFLNRNQYAIVFGLRCNYSCSYCCNYASPRNPKSEVERNAAAFIELFNRVDPGVIMLSGGEPFLWKDLPTIIGELPQHYWVILTNLSSVPKWVEHVNIKLVIPAYHEEFAREESFTDRLIQLKDVGKRVHVKLIVKPEQEYDQIHLWDMWNSMGVPSSLVPLDYTYFFRRDFLQDLITKYRTCSLYNARFFRVDVAMNIHCFAGTRKMFQVMPDGRLVRCSRLQVPIGNDSSSIASPTFDDQSRFCDVDGCYCEWHHWASATPANDNRTWTDYVETGTWRYPSVDELAEFVAGMNWDARGRTIEGSTASLFPNYQSRQHGVSRPKQGFIRRLLTAVRGAKSPVGES